MDKAPGLEFWGGAGGTDRGGSERRWAPSPIRRAWLVGRRPRASSAQGSSGDTLCPTPSPVCYVPGWSKLETFTPRDGPAHWAPSWPSSGSVPAVYSSGCER